MDWTQLKESIFVLFVIYMIVMISLEYPFFGIIVLVSILAFSIWVWIDSQDVKKRDKKIETQNNKKFKQLQKRKKQREKRQEDLRNKLSEEITSIIENNIKIIATAYRTAVTSNSFGKKNYNKFIPELAEFIEDNSKILKKLIKFYEDDEFYDTWEINYTNDSVIEFIENEIEKLNQNEDYTDDMGKKGEVNVLE